MPVSTEQVWERFQDDLRKFIARRVRDQELAADLLQETFVRIHRGLGSLKDDDRVLAWVYRVARNSIADHFRKSARTETDESAEAPATGPDRANHDEDLGRCLLGMLPAMPEKYRAAIELAEIEGLPQQEVAQRLGLSVSGAKSRVQRGREMMRRMLLDCCHLEFDRRGNVVDYERRGGCGGCGDCRSDDTEE